MSATTTSAIQDHEVEQGGSGPPSLPPRAQSEESRVREGRMITSPAVVSRGGAPDKGRACHGAHGVAEGLPRAPHGADVPDLHCDSGGRVKDQHQHLGRGWRRARQAKA